MEMDKVSRALFEDLVQKDPSALNEADREFLKARRSYMSSEQRLKFTTFLDEVAQADPNPAPGSVAAHRRDIQAAMEAEAERRASTATLDDDTQRALDQAARSEAARQKLTATALEAQQDAEKERIKQEEQARKDAEKAAKKAAKEAKRNDKTA